MAATLNAIDEDDECAACYPAILHILNHSNRAKAFYCFSQLRVAIQNGNLENDRKRVHSDRTVSKSDFAVAVIPGFSMQHDLYIM